jgi:hypothetical protein
VTFLGYSILQKPGFGHNLLPPAMAKRIGSSRWLCGDRPLFQLLESPANRKRERSETGTLPPDHPFLTESPMADGKSFSEKIANLQAEIKNLPDTHDAAGIEQTARRLEALNYSPPLIIPTATFVRLDRAALLEQVDAILAMEDAAVCALAPDNRGECEDLRVQYLTVILYHYRKLLKLRDGNPEEWDEIDELYVHD